MPIALGNWEPDAPDFGTAKVYDVSGCMPIVGGYGPFPSLDAISASLGSKCLGAISVRRSTSFYDLFAGTVDKLFHYNSGTASFDDVSGATYNVPDANIWQFRLFGSHLLAVNGADPLQDMDLTAITTFAAIAAAPVARFIDVVGDFVMLGCLSDAENAVQWAFQDHTTWPIGSGNGDRQLFADGGAVRGLAASEAGLIFQETKVRSMSLVGAGDIFQFQEIGDQRTLRAPYSLVKAGPRTYGWFETGLEYYENNVPVPFGFGRVNDWLKTNANAQSAFRMIGCADPVNSRLYWAFRSVDESVERFDTILIYDYRLDRFSKISGQFSFVFPAVSAGLTLEALDAYGTLDTLPYSLDSAVWGGGVPGLAGFNDDGAFGFFASDSMAGRLDTAEAQIMAPSRAFVRSLLPIGDAPDITVAAATRERRTEPFVWGTATGIGRAGSSPQRASGRYHRFRLSIPAASSWTHMIGIEVDAAQDGYL